MKKHKQEIETLSNEPLIAPQNVKRFSRGCRIKGHSSFIPYEYGSFLCTLSFPKFYGLPNHEIFFSFNPTGFKSV